MNCSNCSFVLLKIRNYDMKIHLKFEVASTNSGTVFKKREKIKFWHLRSQWMSWSQWQNSPEFNELNILNSENPGGHEIPSGIHTSPQSTGKEWKHEISYFLVIWTFQELLDHKTLSWEVSANFEWIQS